MCLIQRWSISQRSRLLFYVEKKQTFDDQGNSRTVTEFNIVQGHDDAIHFFPGVKV